MVKAKWTAQCVSGVTCETVDLAVNESKDYDYSGMAKGAILSKSGYYKLEVWGAQGGNGAVGSSTFAGGKGGFSVGTIYLDSGKDIYIYVGSKGKIGTAIGCVTSDFNGGGNGCQSKAYVDALEFSGSGGGVSDIRIGDTSLYARVIVAGGGGGGHTYNQTNYNGNTGYGGGTSGQDGSQDRAGQTIAGGGTQIAGGNGGRGFPAYAYAESGSYGIGGSGLSIPSSAGHYLGSGGGGGWYGGGGGGHFSGAGGSGWVYTASTYSYWATNSTEGKNGNWLLDSCYYLTSASTVNGGTTFKSPSGINETGHSGNGYARITYLGTGI